MKKGLLIYHPWEERWRVWIRHKAYHIEPGEDFQIKIKDIYFNALLEQAGDWMITIQKDSSFVLHPNEVYKILINPNHLFLVETPF